LGERDGDSCYDRAMSDRLDPTWVDDAKGVRQAAAACAAMGRFAVDTEADSLHSYFHKVCLIQVSAGDRHWLLDPLAISSDDLTALWKVIEDPKLEIVMHGADYDLRVLDRDFGVHIRGLEDTQMMAQLLGEQKTGLAALLEKEFGLQLDKRHQRADWGRRPLSPDQLAYAARDTAHLVQLADRLRSRLDAMGRWDWADEEFKKLEQVRYEPPVEDPLAFERLKGARSLKGGDRDRLCALHGWREGEAQRRDLPPFKVIGNRPLMELAQRKPETVEELVEVPGLGHRFARRWGRRVLRILAKPGTAPPRGARSAAVHPSPKVKSRMKRLLAVRDAAAEELGLPPGLVASRALVQSVSEDPPSSGSTAAGAPAAGGLEGWRLKLLGERVVKALEEDE
jgi:ribonuclease D